MARQRSQCSKEKLSLRQHVDGIGLIWKSALCSLGIIWNTMLLISKIQWFLLFYNLMTTYRCRHRARFSWVGRQGLDSPFIIPLAMIFTLTSYTWRAILDYCHIFILSQIIDIHVNYGRSTFAIEYNGSNRKWSSESGSSGRESTDGHAESPEVGEVAASLPPLLWHTSLTLLNSQIKYPRSTSIRIDQQLTRRNHSISMLKLWIVP
jgi:hypothetical protein